MRFMLIRKAGANTERGDTPSAELLAAMTDYNMAMANAGVLVDGAGLKPSSCGARVRIDGVGGAAPTVVDGPFAETKELLAGFTIINVASLDEAKAWVKRWPPEDGPVEIEIRQFYEMEDFADVGPLDGMREAFAKAQD
jgi:hypothetical protein